MLRFLYAFLIGGIGLGFDFCVQPTGGTSRRNRHGIFTAPEPHFMLHCTKCSLRQTLSVNQTNCHRSGHDRIIGEVRFLAQQRKILVLVIVVVKFIGTAHDIAQNRSQHKTPSVLVVFRLSDKRIPQTGGQKVNGQATNHAPSCS